MLAQLELQVLQVVQVDNILVVVAEELDIMDQGTLDLAVVASSLLNTHNNFKGRNKWHILQK
jgi:hypothetical protein